MPPTEGTYTRLMFNLQQLREQARPILERYHPGHGEAISLILRPVINLGFRAASDDELSIGSSKSGGRPDLGRRRWPRRDGEPLIFVAQFNMAELKPADEDDLFPSAGLLSFFLSEDGEGWAIVYEPDTSTLRRASKKSAEGVETLNPHAIAFRSGVHPWGDVGVWQEDGTRLSLLFDGPHDDAEWKALIPEGDVSTEGYLLGDMGVAHYNLNDQQEDEAALLTIPESSEYLNPCPVMAFAFLMPGDDLKRGDFRKVRLVQGFD